MLKLKNSVKVFVPVTNNNGDKVDLSFETTNALNVIGVATTFTASGNWIENGKLYTDNINVMQFNCNEFDNDTVHVINELIRAIFIKAEQLAVSVEVNGTLYILDSVNDINELF